MGSIPMEAVHLRAGLTPYLEFQQRISPYCFFKCLWQEVVVNALHEATLVASALWCFSPSGWLRMILGWLRPTMRSRLCKYNASFISWKTPTIVMPTIDLISNPSHYLSACSTPVPKQSFLHSHSSHKRAASFPHCPALCSWSNTGTILLIIYHQKVIPHLNNSIKQF